MSKTEMIRARVEPDLKHEAEAVFDALGLTSTEAITLFYKQVKFRHGLPFEVKMPNKETLTAMRDAEQGKNLKKWKSLDALKAAHRVRKILATVKPLAAEYYKLTGKPLGVTGEVAEYVAAEILNLELAPPRTLGYDATRQLRKGKQQRIQIKGRACDMEANPGRRLGTIGTIKRDSPCDSVLLVLFDNRTLDPCEMWEAPMKAVNKRLAVPESKAHKRGVLGVSEFKKHCSARCVWPKA